MVKYLCPYSPSRVIAIIRGKWRWELLEGCHKISGCNMLINHELMYRSNDLLRGTLKSYIRDKFDWAEFKHLRVLGESLGCSSDFGKKYYYLGREHAL
jgi:hypothetical protein